MLHFLWIGNPLEREKIMPQNSEILSQDVDTSDSHGSPLFVISYLRWEVVIVGFVDIGGIVDHHCLNFLIITVTD